MTVDDVLAIRLKFSRFLSLVPAVERGRMEI